MLHVILLFINKLNKTKSVIFICVMCLFASKGSFSESIFSHCPTKINQKFVSLINKLFFLALEYFS